MQLGDLHLVFGGDFAGSHALRGNPGTGAPGPQRSALLHAHAARGHEGMIAMRFRFPPLKSSLHWLQRQVQTTLG
jgi:hypothetical protein